MSQKLPPLPALTAVRFFAALMVVFVHLDTQKYPFLKAVHMFNLDQAVSFFFILSGFILTYAYHDLTPQKIPQFLAGRFARLWPAHLFTAILAIVIIPRRLTNAVHAAPALLVILSQLLMTHSWVPLQKWYASLNSVSWSIATEFFFYLTFPFIQHIKHTNLIKISIALLLLITSVAVMGESMQLSPDNTGNLNLVGLLYIWPVCRLLEFVAGMWTGRLFLKKRSHTQKTTWKNTFIEIAVLTFTGTLMMLSNAAFFTGFLFKVSPAFKIITTMYGLTLLPFCMVIYTLAQGKGLISRVLSLSPLVFLGEISYALYLVHKPLLWIDYPLPLPVLLMALLLAASAVYFGIEKPGRILILRLFHSCARLIQQWSKAPTKPAITEQAS